MIENSPLQIRDERQLRALTGTSESQFKHLEEEFSKVYEEKTQAEYEAAVKAGKRARKLGGGRKGVLMTIALKLLFLLYYMKNYPTFDTLGSIFGLSRSKSCENVHKLMPILYETLHRLGFLPHREFDSVEAFRKAFEGVEYLAIDATERAHQRPQDNDMQKELYSGKQKDHTTKNTVISTPERAIRYLGYTMSGHNHDFYMLKKEFSPDEDWLKNLLIYVDLGYLGIVKTYNVENINIPYRRPRKTTDNPEPTLTKEQKEHNRMVSKLRIFVENAISGLKRYNILVHDFRNKKDNFVDDVAVLCAGLWNMMLGVEV